MATLDELRAYAQNPNVRQFLDVIAQAEGATGYDTAFGGGRIPSLADHPRQLHDFTQTDGRRNRTSAAGRYQFLQGTWDDVAGKLGLRDFGPESQDIAAVELLRRNGSLDPLLQGDFQTAVQRSGRTWASLPSSPYAQPRRSQGFIASALDRAAQAVLPSAQAGTMPQTANPFDQFDEPAAPAQQANPFDQFDAPAGQSLAPNGQPWLPLGQTNIHPQDEEEVQRPDAEPSGVGNFARGVVQGVTDLFAGTGQNAGHEALTIINAVAPNSDAARRVRERVAEFDRTAINRERDYQGGTPGSIAAGAGRLIGGSVLPGTIGSRLLTVGGNLGRAGVASLTSNAAAQGAGRLAGQAAGSGVLGAGLATSQPITEAGDFGDLRRSQALMGGAVGGAIPAATAAARGAVGSVSPEVARLAQRAQELGVRIRPDQLLSSKPVNALSAALDYLPFSGRQGALTKQQKQFNTAVSRTIGENTDNLAAAINNASRRLSSEFDKYLKNTVINVDQTFQADLSRVLNAAREEMTEQQFSVISRQANNILSKIKGNTLDADAAYNLKKIFDRIGKSSDSTLAHYGRELRSALLDALNRSLPDGGADFAKVRQQWGNLRELEKLVPRGAEGSVSAARLANARGIRGGELNDLANIAAQFLKPRVGDSGTAQRAGAYAGLLGPGLWYDPLSVGLGLGVGRAANTVLGNDALANSMIRGATRGAGLNGNAASVAAQPALQSTMRGLFPDLYPALITGAAGLSVAR